MIDSSLFTDGRVTWILLIFFALSLIPIGLVLQEMVIDDQRLILTCFSAVIQAILLAPFIWNWICNREAITP